MMKHSKGAVVSFVSMIGLLTGIDATLFAAEESKVAQFIAVPAES